MSNVIKSTDYCDLLVQAIVQEGSDISAVEKIYVKALAREEIRFTWYTEKEGKARFQLRPLDLPEEELLELMTAGFQEEVFSPEFRNDLKRILQEFD
jgi:hypothetical protein